MNRMLKINQLARLLFLLILASPISLHADEADASRYYESALALMDQSDLKGAIIELKNALQQNSNFLAARILQGKIYVLLKQGADAEKQLTDANQLGADKSVTLAPLAKAYLLQEKYKQLLNNIDPEGQSRSIQSELYAYRGHAYLELREASKAMDAFKTSERLNPDSDLAFTGQAMVLLRKGELDEAAKLADRATTLEPSLPDPWNVKASISHAQGKLDKALKEYSKAISLKAKNLDARIARAGIYIDQKKYPEAAIDLEYLRNEFPGDPQSAYLLSVLQTKQGAPEASKQAINKAADILDTYKESYLEKSEKLLMLAGLVNYDLKRFEKAKNYLGKYIKQFPGQSGARKLLGSVLIQQSKFSRAIVILSPALNYIPDDVKLLSMLGAAYMNTGQHTRANNMLEKAVTLSNGAIGLRTSRALNHLKAGKQKIAIEQLIEIFEQDSLQIRAGIALSQTYLKLGEFTKALQTARKLSNLQPKDVQLLNLLGSTQVRKGSYKEARATFNRAVQLNPEFIQTRLNLGKLDILENNADKARQRYTHILEEQADNIPAMIEMARLEDTLGRNKEAIRWLEKARSTDKNFIEAILYLADLYIRTGNPKKSLEIAREAGLVTPKNMEVLAASARANLGVGKPEIARVIYRKMFSLAGSNPEVLYQIALHQMGANILDDAIFTLQQTLNTNPDHLLTQVKLVQALLLVGQTEEAYKPAKKLREKYPEQAFGYRLVGDVFMQQQKFKDAEKSYRVAMKKDKSTQHAILIYQAKSSAGNQQSAVRFLEQWTKSYPKDQVARMALAEGNLKLGRLEIARTQYERLLENNPKLPGILNNLANIYYRLNDKRALSTAEKAYELAPEDVSINDSLGWIMANQGQAERSLRYLRDAYYRASSNPEIRYHIAFALEKLGRKEEARKELEAALHSKQPFDGIEEARKLQKKLNR